MSYPSDQHSMEQHAAKGLEVFVGGLARNTTENKIREVFSSCGEIVDIRVIKDQQGNSKGFGFVRFATKEAADKAVREKSGSMLDGKKIGVLPSAHEDTLFFGNLHKGWTSDEFDRIVRQVFPDVVSVDLAKPMSSGDTLLGQKHQNRGFAFVKFTSHAAAARAHRAASKPDFILAGSCHPSVDWAEEEPEIDPEELVKIKIGFVRNLPTDSNENYLKKLFEPFGKLDRVVLSSKGRTQVGFIHFAQRSDLDNAIKEMNERTIQGPNGGPPFKLQVEVARPMDKNRKRARSDTQNRAAGNIPSQSKPLVDDYIQSPSGGSKSKVQKVMYSKEEPVVADPYESAVVSLPVAVKERLLRILRLGIATRFDIDIQSLTSLKELPESNAISVLDQFMLSGADKHNKGAYLSALISVYQVDKFAINGQALNHRRVADTTTVESNLPTFSSRVHLQASDPLSSRVQLHASDPHSSRVHLQASDPLSSRVHLQASDPLSHRVHLQATDPYSSRVPLQANDPLASRYVSTAGRYDGYTSIYTTGYTSALSDYPLTSRPSLIKLEETNPSWLHRTMDSSTHSGKVGLDSHLTAVADRPPTVGLGSHLTAAADRPPTRTQIRFDPFTGEPYKFDPFTGEPIRPESPTRRFGGPY